VNKTTRKCWDEKEKEFNEEVKVYFVLICEERKVVWHQLIE